MSVLYLRDKKGNFLPIRTINGKSAYEIAVDNGFEGTEAEWLESLKSTVVFTDKTLSQSDQAADAKATGDAIKAVEELAEVARGDAGTAKASADTAQNIANSAFSTAQSAQLMATRADSAATAASSAAETAGETAATAKETAEKALQRSGGTMTGDLNMGGNQVTGLGEPANTGDAIGKGYVVPPSEGGTGKTTLSDALNALLASGPIILTSQHYGNELPAPGIPGRLFFKKVSD